MVFSADVYHRAQSRLGTILNGKWRLDQVLGVGGMATVFEATHRNQKRVAVKMLHPELSLDESVRLRFLREGYVANSVGHPGAVTIFDDDIAEDGSAFLVMELLEGETAHARLQREGVFAVDEALTIGEATLDILIAAHDKGIVHRDVKPENLFLTKAGEVKLLDFGIARLRELPMGTGASTANGFFMGTPAFMSPEHARGKWNEVDPRSDIWSVGATLFTLLTGKFVHESETPVDALVLAVTVPPPPIRTVATRIPDPVADVVDRALAYDKEERWENARAMQKALHHAHLALAPEELVVRGGQRSDPIPERSPSSPRGDASKTVRSSLPVSPRLPGSHSEPSPRPLATDSLEPIDTMGGAAHQRSGKRRGAWSIAAALALVALVGIAIAALPMLRRRSRGVIDSTGEHQVLAPSSERAPSQGEPVPSLNETANEPPATAASDGPLVAAPSSASATLRLLRPDRHPKMMHVPAVQSAAPPAPSAPGTNSEPARDNPFDRRF
jgi:serine/threonine-protein kinase